MDTENNMALSTRQSLSGQGAQTIPGVRTDLMENDYGRTNLEQASAQGGLDHGFENANPHQVVGEQPAQKASPEMGPTPDQGHDRVQPGLDGSRVDAGNNNSLRQSPTAQSGGGAQVADASQPSQQGSKNAKKKKKKASKRVPAAEFFGNNADSLFKPTRVRLVPSEGKSFAKTDPFLLYEELVQKCGFLSNKDLFVEGKVVIVNTPSTEFKNKMENLETLQGIPLAKVENHNRFNTIRGVIREQMLRDVPLERALRGMRNCGVTKVTPLGRAGRTPLFLIEFEKQRLPDLVWYGWMPIQVRPYEPRPRQCQKCFHFGHSAQFCRSASKVCLNCGKNNCPQASKPDECSGRLNCSLCKSSLHNAKSKSCPKYKTEEAILRLVEQEKLSFRLARFRVGAATGPSPSVRAADLVTFPPLPSKASSSAPGNKPIPKTGVDKRTGRPTVVLQEHQPTLTSNRYDALDVEESDQELTTSNTKSLKRVRSSPSPSPNKSKDKAARRTSISIEEENRRVSRSLAAQYNKKRKNGQSKVLSDQVKHNSSCEMTTDDEMSSSSHSSEFEGWKNSPSKSKQKAAKGSFYERIQSSQESTEVEVDPSTSTSPQQHPGEEASTKKVPKGDGHGKGRPQKGGTPSAPLDSLVKPSPKHGPIPLSSEGGAKLSSNNNV